MIHFTHIVTANKIVGFVVFCMPPYLQPVHASLVKLVMQITHESLIKHHM